MRARLVFSAGLAALLAVLFSIPDFAPLKQVAPAQSTQARLALSGLWRIGLSPPPLGPDHEPDLNRERVAAARACAPTPDGGWPDAGNVDVPRLAIAVMAAEAVSRPGWRQLGEILYAEGIEALGQPVPNMTYGPLQIRASRAVEHVPELIGSQRAAVVMRLEDPCFSLAVASRMLSKSLQESEGADEDSRVLAAASDYSGYLGDSENYSYAALTLEAYRFLNLD